MYQLKFEADEIRLREQDGSGYIVRCCRKGRVETRVICASGDISEPVERTPEAFLAHHPDAAEVPGIGAALFRLASSPNGSPPQDAPGTSDAPARSGKHFKPVLRAIRN